MLQPMFLPWRFGLFLLLCLSALPLLAVAPTGFALLGGFDIAAFGFLLSVIPLLSHDHRKMRVSARRNDANRTVILLITGIVMIVLLILVASELTQRQSPTAAAMALILGTLAVAWTFANTVYALHYAYLYYSPDADGADLGGIDFPDTQEPDYWDFAYFAFTLGMTFQTSDVAIGSRAVRKVVTFHCLAAFVFNLGIIAFTINVLGGG